MPRTRTEFQALDKQQKNKKKQQSWRDKRKENPDAHSEFKSTERMRLVAYRANQRREMSETDKQARREQERIRKAAYRKKKKGGEMVAARQVDINECKEKERIKERAKVIKMRLRVCLRVNKSHRKKASRQKSTRSTTAIHGTSTPEKRPSNLVMSSTQKSPEFFNTRQALKKPRRKYFADYLQRQNINSKC